MVCNRCGTCCLETEMLLSTKDIERLIKKGYSTEFFTRHDNEGYIILKNQTGGRWIPPKKVRAMS